MPVLVDASADPTSQEPAPHVLQSSASGSRASINWPRIAVIVGAVLGVVPSAVGVLNHDVAWYLYGSRRLMAGERLYIDIEDVNPPLVFFLGAPVEWLAMTLGVPELYVVATAIAVMSLVAIGLAARAFAASPGGVDLLARVTIGAWLAATLLLPGYDFGQREHWVVILLFPFCVASVLTAESPLRLPRWTAIGIGLLGGLAFSVKPHFAALPVVFWALVAMRRRSLHALITVENVLVVSVMASFAAFVLLVTPAYLFSIVPLARQQYWAFEIPLSYLLTSQDVLLVVGASVLTALGGMALTGSRRGGLMAQQMGVLALAFLAAYVVQQKGWWYQLLPAKIYAVVAAVLTVAALADAAKKRKAAQVPSPRPLLALRAIAVGLGTVPVVFFIILAGETHWLTLGNIRNPRPTPLFDLVKSKAAGRPLYMISTSVPPAWPYVNLTGATWPYHYPHLWALPGFYRNDVDPRVTYRSLETQSAFERRVFRTVVDDLVRTPPTILMVDIARYKQAFGVAEFDYIHYFSQDPAFRALFAEYRRIATYGALDVYEHVPTAAAMSRGPS